MEQNLNQIYQKYTQLLPSREEGMVIFHLNQRIKSEDIDTCFSRSDIENVVQEIAKLGVGDSTPNVSRIINQLLQYFLENPPQKPYRYQLTEYAKRFLALVENKLNNRLKDVPLKESFEQFALPKSGQITNIIQLNQWFELGFTDNGRKLVTRHLEAFKDDVLSLTKKLNGILYMEEQNARFKVESFAEIFGELGDRSDQIGETLALRNSLDKEIDSLVDSFYQKIEEFKNPTNEQEQTQFNTLKHDYERALEIQKEVNAFFDIVDTKFEQIVEKMQYAMSKFEDLKDNLRYQSKFKINTRRFLKFTLEQAAYNRESPVLNVGFPKRYLVSESFKFINVNHIRFLNPPKRQVRKRTKNEAYVNQARDKITKKFGSQHKIREWTQRCKQILIKEGKLDFTEHFYRILDEEKDVKIPLAVSHELVRFVSDNPDYEIVIKKEILTEFRSKDVLTWKTKINHHTYS